MNHYLYYLGFFLVFLMIGYSAGAIAEKRHYRSIINRERAYLHLRAVTLKSPPYEIDTIASAQLVYGTAVISVNYAIRILAWIRNLFGGTIKSYESLLDRACRESMLRMKEMAKEASMIINVRVETSTIGNTTNKNGITCLEAISYGTALFLKK